MQILRKLRRISLIRDYPRTYLTFHLAAVAEGAHEGRREFGGTGGRRRGGRMRLSEARASATFCRQVIAVDERLAIWRARYIFVAKTCRIRSRRARLPAVSWWRPPPSRMAIVTTGERGCVEEGEPFHLVRRPAVISP